MTASGLCEIEVIDYYREEGDREVRLTSTEPSITSTLLERFPVDEFLVNTRDNKGERKLGRGWEAAENVCKFVHDNLGGIATGDTLMHLCPDGAIALCVVAPIEYWHGSCSNMPLSYPQGYKLILVYKNYKK